MKKFSPISLIAVFAILFAQTAEARILRVNNTGITGPNIYISLTDAYNAAVNDDTIHIEPSATAYANLSCYKRLTIIGNGYLLGQNLNLQANPSSSNVDYIYFYAGSEGSKVSGLNVYQPQVYCNNITFERCYFRYQMYVSSGNLVLRQNYFEYPYQCINVLANCNNILITNNIFRGYFDMAATASGIIKNNVIYSTYGYGCTVYNCNVVNNIMYAGTFSQNGASNVFFNNIGTSTQFPVGNGNQQNIPLANIFTLTGSNDGVFQIIPNGPAFGTGQSGEDCGAFGGLTPYKLSGIPNSPSIYYIAAPSSGTNVINVTVSTRSNN